MAVSTPSSEQRIAVVTALAANIAIAVAKLGAAVITGSSAMLAEALHSFADSVNEVLLLVGARRSRRPADRRHPFGHARYRYVYAFLCVADGLLGRRSTRRDRRREPSRGA
ncbi:MAG: cation transporter [Chloroflexota bacterium]